MAIYHTWIFSNSVSSSEILDISPFSTSLAFGLERSIKSGGDGDDGDGDGGGGGGGGGRVARI